jgi:putative Mg2+ transporter-C (MgtC) family protein
MAAVQAFQPGAFLDSALSLLVAFLLGALIGAERQYRQRTAGLRTTTLVAVGACAFVDLGMRLNANAGAAAIALTWSRASASSGRA